MQLMAPRGRSTRLRAAVTTPGGDPLTVDEGERISFTCSDRMVEPRVSLIDGVLDITFPPISADFRWSVWVKSGADVVSRVASGHVRVVDG